MRKLILGIAIAATMTAASADVKTGFYIGVNASANVLYGTAKWTWDDHTPANQNLGANASMKSKSELGNWGPGAGVYAGYGFIWGCAYLGGELAYQYNHAVASHHFTAVLPSGTNSPYKTYLKIKNENVFNFAALIGWRATPSTILYFRLGGNVGQPKTKSRIFIHKLNESKSRLSFAPGAGIETFFYRNWKARVEYTHDIGNRMSNTFTESTVQGTVRPGERHRIRTKRINLHTANLGIAYVF